MKNIKSKKMAALAATLLVALPLVYGQSGHSARDKGIVILRDRIVTMRDGAKLAADVHLPDGEPANAFPTILIRSTYNKDQARKQLNTEYFLEHGYAVVIQDVRGRYKSDGSHYHGIAEMNDGYDTIEWVAQQPWSNRKVGMTGISYLAAVQSAAAIANPPHLSSMFHVKAPSNYYQNGFRHAGALLMYSLPIAFMLASSNKEVLANPLMAKGVGGPDLWRRAAEWLPRMPLKRGLTPISLDPETERWFFDMVEHTDYDDFWKKVPLWQPEEYFKEHKDIPGYYIGGWYDLYREESFYTGLSKLKKSSVLLMMGPWTHSDFARSSGEVDFGPEAAMTDDAYNDLQLAWFDQTLKGNPEGMLQQPPVKIFVMGGGDGRKNQEGRMRHNGRWRMEREWPLARARSTKYYLSAGGALSVIDSGDQPPSTYIYDPKNPVPTIGGPSYFLSGVTGGLRPELQRHYVPYGAYDQRESLDYFGCHTTLPLSSRHDVLVFQTAPLEADTEVTGPLSVKLWIASSAVDTDFTAKLIDVYPMNEDYPEGFAMNLSDSILRARYRNGFDKSRLMTPGEIYELTIDMPPTSNLFQKRHRIRLDISSSNYPTYDPNPNTGDPYLMNGKSIPAENRIYHDRNRPSHIVLPVISAR
jgi:putative CocE/NonD family hydrolase